MTAYTALVERVYRTPAGRHVRVRCPFGCPDTHEHRWPDDRGRNTPPSSEVLAPCSRAGELLTYKIDPRTAFSALRVADDARDAQRRKKGAQR